MLVAQPDILDGESRIIDYREVQVLQVERTKHVVVAGEWNLYLRLGLYYCRPFESALSKGR